MNRILDVEAEPVFGWGASLVVSLALAGAAALTGWCLAGLPVATGLPQASGPVPDLTQAQVWLPPPRPSHPGARREPPGARARNGAIPVSAQR